LFEFLIPKTLWHVQVVALEAVVLKKMAKLEAVGTMVLVALVVVIK
jgi:hypothetical protein